MLKNALKQYKKEMIIGPIFKMIEAIFELAIPLLMAKVIDDIIPLKDTKGMLLYILLMLGLTLLGFIASIICQYYAAIAGFGVGKKIRDETFNHLMTLSDQALENHSKEYFVSNVTSDAEAIQNAVNMAIRLATRAPFILIGSMILAYTIYPKLIWIFLIVTFLMLGVFYLVMKLSIKKIKKTQVELDYMMQGIKEIKSGSRVIRVFSKQKETQNSFEKRTKTYYKLSVFTGKLNSILNPINYLLIHIGVIIVIYMGIDLVQNGLVKQGEMIALMSYFTQILVSMVVFVNLIVLFTKGQAAYQRLSEVMALENDIQKQEAIYQDTDKLLVFDHVSFGFHNEEPTIREVSFSMTKGSSLGIIGRTGSGKTTLINLMLRKFDPTQGKIYYQGRSLDSFELEEIKSLIGIAFQNSYLFKGTIRSNLLMANPNLEDQTIDHILKMSQADFVYHNPKTIDQEVEGGGTNFSGGQKQRINIARALAKNVEVLILDDANSALDFVTDMKLRQMLKTLQLTTVIVSQRISSIQECDQIIVLEKGSIEAIGTHEELLNKNTFYREIYASQVGEYHE